MGHHRQDQAFKWLIAPGGLPPYPRCSGPDTALVRTPRGEPPVRSWKAAAVRGYRMYTDVGQRPPWRRGLPATYVLPIGFAALLAVGTVAAALHGRLDATGV